MEADTRKDSRENKCHKENRKIKSSDVKQHEVNSVKILKGGHKHTFPK